MESTLSIDQLRTFIEIAKVGSYTRAAENLFRTQPALSMQMKKLEEQIGTRVFMRDGKQVAVTEAGQVLLNYAQRILSLNEQALSKLAAVETEGSVKIGVLEEVTLGPLVDLLTKFGRLCTKIRLELLVATSSELTQLIENNKIYLAIANTAHSTAPACSLWTEEYVWATNPASHLHLEDPIPLVMDPLTVACQLRDDSLRELDEIGRKWTVAFSSVSLTAMQAAVTAGLGIGILARSALVPEMSVLTVEDGFPVIEDANIGLLRAADANTPAVDCLADFLITHLKS
ncbi:MAG: LysR family transcriptional regulator [Rhodothermales bacterium]|nr:LysR family transcriptional regulator [Rhodothermales bacterium]